MRQKKGWIAGIAVIAVIALLFVGYNLYRYPAMFRSLSDNSLNDSQVEELREEILSQPDVDVLVSYFSYSGNTRNVAAALSEKTGGDLFEIVPLNGYSIEMSVMTEVSDLEAVMEAASEWDFADESRIVLLGTSQGGIVSAIAAARHTDQVSGLVLMYPAFLVSGAIHEQFDSLEEVPDSYRFNWITAGRPYAEDMWDYDVYEEIGNYTDKVLLLHGSADSIVPISYSDRAAEVYEDVDYHVIDGAGHGFSGSAFDEAVRYVFDYLQQIEII